MAADAQSAPLDVVSAIAARGCGGLASVQAMSRIANHDPVTATLVADVQPHHSHAANHRDDVAFLVGFLVSEIVNG